MIRIEPSKVGNNAKFPIADALGVGVATIDDSGCQSYVNSAFAEMVGWTPSELIGAGAPFKYWPEEETDNINDAFARAVAGVAPPGGFELRFMRKTGERFPVLVIVSPINVDGVNGWAAAVVDNSEKKRVEEALQDREQRLDMSEQQARLAREEAERANRSKSEFLAAMSHELRTPLNAIGGYLDLLDLEIHGPVTPQQRRSFRSIKRNQDHLLVVINDLLDFAKVEAGRIEFRIVDLPVAAFVSDMESLLEPQAAARGIEFTLEPINSAAVMRADRERLQQILLNLVSNAVKFTAAGGSLRVHCDEHAALVRIHVTDTGRGIEKDQIETIFEPFVQIDRMKVVNSEKGVGLGLSISRDLARGMGGDLTVQSTPGSGSTFTVALPRVRGTAEDLL